MRVYENPFKCPLGVITSKGEVAYKVRLQYDFIGAPIYV